MFRRLLRKIGYEIVYVHNWGTYTSRYDGVDRACGRPIHPGMSVAPPSAKMKIRKIV